jgi:hypothetical protein
MRHAELASCGRRAGSAHARAVAHRWRMYSAACLESAQRGREARFRWLVGLCGCARGRQSPGARSAGERVRVSPEHCSSVSTPDHPHVICAQTCPTPLQMHMYMSTANTLTSHTHHMRAAKPWESLLFAPPTRTGPGLPTLPRSCRVRRHAVFAFAHIGTGMGLVLFKFDWPIALTATQVATSPSTPFATDVRDSNSNSGP